MKVDYPSNCEFVSASLTGMSEETSSTCDKERNGKEQHKG